MNVATLSHGRLHCRDHPDVFCECISDFMHKNGDAPLTPGGIWVPMFRAINVPDGTGGWVTDLPFHVEMILLTRDENGVAEATYKGRGGGVRPLCLVGPNDGRYAIRTAILIDLRSLVERGQPTCDGNFHDGRYDRDYGYEVQYTTTNLHRARLLDTYSRTYLGSCWPCLQRESNHDLGNLAAL